MLEGSPDYLFVDVGLGRAGSPDAAGLKRIDFLEIYSVDPDIARALARYHTIAIVSQIQILARDDSTARAVPR
jgi:hypothetical protein